MAFSDDPESQFAPARPPDPAYESPEIGETVPDIAAAPPARRILPAALRVILYLVAWAPTFCGSHFAALVGYFLVVVLALGGDFQAASRSIQEHFSNTNLPPLPVLAAAHVMELGGALLVTAIFAAYVDRRRLRTVGFELVRGWPWHWVLGIGVEAAHFGCLFLIGLAAGWYHVVHVVDLPRALAIVFIAFAIALPAAATEEITMRGYVLQTIRERYGTAWAVVVSSILFAAMHSFNPGGFKILPLLGLLVAGVYLSAAYLATGQLWLPIAMHTIWNVMEGPVFGLPVSGVTLPDTVLKVETRGPALWTGGEFGPEAGLPVFVTTVVWTAIVWWSARKLLPGKAQAT